MDFKLELVHLQLAIRCNLRCPFCGQWGAKGFAKGSPASLPKELPAEDWLRIIDELASFSGSKGLPGFILWGGEPFLHEGCGEIVAALRDRSLAAAIVTNGVLLESNAEIASQASRLYISLDGPGELHDSIRGFKNLHLKIERGLAALSGCKVPKTALCVINERNFDKLPEIASYAGRIGFDQIIFQNLIFLLPAEAKRFGSWLRSVSGCDLGDGAPWIFEALPPFSERLPSLYADMERRVAAGEFPLSVEFHPLGISSVNVLKRMEGSFVSEGAPAHCLAPFRHLNVAPDGSLRFCVDYNELNLGSLIEKPLRELLSSPLAKRFQDGVASGLNPACGRCPWRCKASYSTV